MTQRTRASAGESQARAQAIDKIVAAARRLFAERGPSEVPLREIAREAGVNYGLIYQYVGTKDDLLQLAINAASDEYAQEFNRANSARAAAEFLMRSRNSEFVRMLARSLLEGRSLEFGQSSAMHELTRRIEETLPASDLNDHDPRVIAAMVTTLSMGWTLFGDYVRTITGLSDVSDEEVKSAMDAIALSDITLG